MSRNKKKPDYDQERILQELVQSIKYSYEHPQPGEEAPDDMAHKQLKLVAEEFCITPMKVRKLLITAGAYSSPLSAQVQRLYQEGKTIKEIQELTQLGRSSVNAYLPYSKTVYNAEEQSTNAERARLYRQRSAIVKKLTEATGKASGNGIAASAETEEILWQALNLFQGYPFHTAKGLQFRYTIRGSEMFVDRKDKSITRSSIVLSFRRVLEMHGAVPGPKKIGTFGASYLYAIYVRFGIIHQDSDG